jgi:propionyl-CoA carboxylase alpha chain
VTPAVNPAGRLPRRVLIANRGEIAVRIAATCRSMGIGVVAVHSDADADALHVRVADQAIRLPGNAPADTYLRADLLLDAAARTGADAVHPGFGFLAEHAGFAQAVLDTGLLWIGPSPASIAAMGDKLEAKRRVAVAGVPLLPGATPDPDADDATLRELAFEVGFPLMVKAAAGGGGKGMRVVADVDALPQALAAARREASGAFGDDRVFLERFVTRPRHVEVQVFGDRHGGLVHLFERECSIQRRHQKVVEESPSPGLDLHVREALCDAALDAVRPLGYEGAGTVEFVADDALLARRRAGEDIDPRTTFAFLEVNTRLQVEHPVTEEVVRVRDAGTGSLDRVDLVRLQLLVAGGASLPFEQQDVCRTGHAIEVRLYAEDTPAGYLPATGTLHAFAPAGGDGIRWDTGVRAGDEITSHYDPMLAKAIAWAPTRGEAASRLAGALDASAILGVTTNQQLLVDLLRDETFLAGATTTGFLAERFPDGIARDAGEIRSGAATAGESSDGPEVDVAIVLAAIHAAQHHLADRRVLVSLPLGFTNAASFPVQFAYDLVRSASGSTSAGRGACADDTTTAAGVPVPHRTVRMVTRRDGRVDVRLLSNVPAGFVDAPGEPVSNWTAEVLDVGPDHLEVDLDGHRRKAAIHRAPGGVLQVSGPRGRVTLSSVPRFPVAAGREAVGATRSPMPGAVVGVAVAVGEIVQAGSLLVTVEAMKMEHRITAPLPGEVTEVRVIPGQQVLAGEVLVVVEDGTAGTDPT